MSFLLFRTLPILLSNIKLPHHFTKVKQQVVYFPLNILWKQTVHGVFVVFPRLKAKNFVLSEFQVISLILISARKSLACASKFCIISSSQMITSDDMQDAKTTLQDGNIYSEKPITIDFIDFSYTHRRYRFRLSWYQSNSSWSNQTRDHVSSLFLSTLSSGLDRSIHRGPQPTPQSPMGIRFRKQSSGSSQKSRISCRISIFFDTSAMDLGLSSSNQSCTSSLSSSS